MGSFRAFFRAHPWQRRLLLAGAAALLGCVVALLSYPLYRDWRLLREMRAGNADATARLAVLAENSSRLRQWLVEEVVDGEPAALEGALKILGPLAPGDAEVQKGLLAALETQDDNRFYRIASALQQHRLLPTGERWGPAYDRYILMRYQHIPPDAREESVVRLRQVLLTGAVLSMRTNVHVRQLAEIASQDDDPTARLLAAPLAARLGLDDVLQNLFSDGSEDVVAAAALAAGYAGRGDLQEDLLDLLDDDEGLEVASSAAMALIRLDAEGNVGQVLSLLDETADAQLRSRLLYVLATAPVDGARAAVAGDLDDAAEANPVALWAAGRLQIRQAGPLVEAVVRRATQEGSAVTAAQLIAALDAASRLGVPVADDVRKILRQSWEARLSHSMIACCLSLAPPAQALSAGAMDETRSVLRQAALFAGSAGADGPEPTPVASAAAAAAAWLLEPSDSWYRFDPESDSPLDRISILRDSSGWLVHHAAGAESVVAGDLLAWLIAGSDRPEAVELARRLLPSPTPRGQPEPPGSLPVHDPHRLTTGAMMLALTARRRMTSREEAMEWIRVRLSGLGGRENDPFLRASYIAALAAAGDADAADHIERLFRARSGPLSRMWLGLIVADRRSAVDWLLWGPNWSDADVVRFLVDADAGRVLEAVAPELPLPLSVAEDSMQQWQVRLLRQAWTQQRHRMSLRWRP